MEYSNSRNEKSTTYDPRVSIEDVERILGIARFDQDWREEHHRPGVVTYVIAKCIADSSGMSYQGSGMGGILLIETILVPGGKGRLVLTGNLGEVISESAELALTLVKSRADVLDLNRGSETELLKGLDVHVRITFRRWVY